MNTKDLIEKFDKTLIRVPKVGRNQPCPCGSGKKFKRCCWPKLFNNIKQENKTNVIK